MYPHDLYDPREQAEALGYTIAHGTLSSSHHDAETYHDRRLILLRYGLDLIEEDCAIAHEIVHIEHRDRPGVCRIEQLRREHRCDRIAAERLIDPNRLRRAMLESTDAGAWCLELCVTPRLMRVYLRHHPEITTTHHGGERTRECAEVLH